MRKKIRICLVCGKEFEGSRGKMTCSGSCRTDMSRTFAKGEHPDFWLIAKSKGMKVPNHEKRETPKPKIPEIPKVQKIEIEQTPVERILTHDQKWEKLEFLKKQLQEVRLKKNTSFMHVRLFKMQQDDKVAELQGEIDSIQLSLKQI